MSPKRRKQQLILKKALARNQKAVAGDYTQDENPKDTVSIKFCDSN